jgi:serine/threonine protein kinase
MLEKETFLKENTGDIRQYYFFIKKVGSGAFGTVYKAKEISTERIVAVKVIHKK